MTTMYENECRRKFYKLLEGYERVSGYSPSQVLSVMVVLDCSVEEAMYLVDEFPKYDDIMWSEATWYEMWLKFTSLKQYLEEDVVNVTTSW